MKSKSIIQMDEISGLDEFKISFNESLEEIIGLINKGRSIEVLYKIIDEIQLQASIIKSKKVTDFNIVNIKREFDKIAIERFSIEAEEFKIFNNIQNTLAHGDLVGACSQILVYKDKFGLKSKVTTNKVGQVYLHNIRDGEVSDKSSFIEQSRTNLIIEQYEFFRQNNFSSAVEEIYENMRERALVKYPELHKTAFQVYLARGVKKSEGS